MTMVSGMTINEAADYDQVRFHDAVATNPTKNNTNLSLKRWFKLLAQRDRETAGHSERVTGMTLHLGRAMRLTENELRPIRWGALLHDIGKLRIPDPILRKTGPLTEAEWAIMRQHPVYAYELLSTIRMPTPVLEIPHYHHERWDGTGYPMGLKGTDIPLAARIFAVVDVWDALRSNRPYRKAWSHEMVREHLQKLSGSHFDPDVVREFLRILPLPPVCADAVLVEDLADERGFDVSRLQSLQYVPIAAL